ncbi:MAG TPA: tRNA lysidine(34) synthetase TilS [Gammaproteobacteria bacterium]|nr:tRNA lysidine(34) synthetase TilS [Gammaproteobacteria bacterium]
MLENKLSAFLQSYGFDRTYWIAYSGGLDSRVLLHCCNEIRKTQPFKFKAIHIHHGISSNADDWLAHCSSVCGEYDMELFHFKVDARPEAGESLEERARIKRYEKFITVLHPRDILLTAQHQDDQAETFFLQLLRGAGPKGLSAMPKVKTLGPGLQARPFLDVTCEELKSYALQHQLTWVEDESNVDSHYPRNFIRHEVLPLLKKRWPAVTSLFARAAENCAETERLLVGFGETDLRRAKGSKTGTLSVKALLELNTEKQRLILRMWLEQQGVILPNAAKLYQIQSNALTAKQDRSPCIRWRNIEVRRYQDDLYVMKALPAHNSQKTFKWDGISPISVPEFGQIEALPVELRQGEIEIRFRQGGEIFRLPNGQHHELRKFFQEKRIPPWERDRLPLIFADGELVLIPGLLVVKK